MAVDSALVLQASTTKATTFSSTPGLKLPTGTPRRGLWVRVIVFDGHSSTTNGALFSVDVSADDSTYYVKTVDNEHKLALTATVQSGEYYLPIEMEGTGELYVRLTCTIDGAGTASVKYQGDILLDHP